MKLKILALLVVLLLPISAHALTAKTRVLVVKDGEEASKEYTKAVMEQVKHVFKRDLGVRLIYRIRYTKDGAPKLKKLNQINKELNYWYKKKASSKKKTYVITSGAYNQNVVYYWGLTKGDLAVGVVRPIRSNGEDGFDFSWVIAAHEIAHLFHVPHYNKGCGIMNWEAIHCAKDFNTIKFSKRAKRKIRKEIKKG